MAYAWSEQATNEAPPRAERIPAGSGIRTRISKVVYGKGEQAFVSRGGDPQIMLIFQDEEGREAAGMYTLSIKAGWTIARLLSCFDPPANLKRMEEDGVEPKDFAYPDFGDANLLDRVVVIDLEYDNNGYAIITPVKLDGSDDSETPPATDESDDPPPSASPKFATKDEAWKAVVAHWPANKSKDDRNQQWITAIKGTGKKEADLTAADWTRVVESVLGDAPF